MVIKNRALIMMLIVLAWPLIFGLPEPQGGFDDRLIAGLFLVILGLGGFFVYLEQIEKEVIAALKNRGDKT